MTAAALANAPRQSITIAVVAALHLSVFLVVAGDTIDIVLPAATMPIDVQLPAPVPEPVPPPELPELDAFSPDPVEPPLLALPAPIPEPTPTPSITPDTSFPTDPNGSGPRIDDYRPPSIVMRRDRLAALIGTCYPPAARRLDEEGRARVRIVVSADGRASSWALAETTGIPRLDSALDCVIRRLQFEPGRRDGRAVEAEVQLPIAFRLD